MREDFLHYIWKHKKFQTTNLKTTCKKDVVLKVVGQHNFNSGPDFFNSQLSLDGLLWVGNVEIHIRSSDWYVHHHEKDNSYDNVILHVVWEHDTDIFRRDNSLIPTLELKNYVANSLLDNYTKLMNQKQLWINCQSDFANVDDFVLNNWLERLFIERLEEKAMVIEEMLRTSKNDWEAVLFRLLAKNFGLKVNGDAFYSMANSIDYSIVRKLQKDARDLEALFFGLSGLLSEDIQEAYYLDLKNRYHFLRSKFQISDTNLVPLKFFRLRPANFPTIRISQLSQLYNKEQTLFVKLMGLKQRSQYYDLFKIETTAFWKIHYTFTKQSPPTKKQLTRSFIDLLLINTIIPLKFSYLKAIGSPNEDDIFKLVREINAETNNVVNKYYDLKTIEATALSSQALLQLNQNYCTKNKCIQCAIGSSLILKN